jgi:hypothetical protein
LLEPRSLRQAWKGRREGGKEEKEGYMLGENILKSYI